MIGNRRAPGSRITRRQSRIRESLGHGFTLLTRFLLASGVQDFTCGFKAFRREAAQEIFQHVTLERWAFDAEVVVIAQEMGLRLAQLPVTWHNEDGSKVRITGAVLGSFTELLTIRWRKCRGLYR